MGELRDRKIVQTRNWLDPNQIPIPSYDYDYTYPISVYEAIRRTTDDDSSTLSDELDSIYRLINEKQNIVLPGTPGNIMLWSGITGQIGTAETVKSINTEPSLRSHQKIPTERAVGDLSDTKASVLSLNTHTNNNSIHLTDVERVRWNGMAPLSSLHAHISNSTMHITDTERSRWNNKANQTEIDDHIYNINNPHHVTAHQAGTYTGKEIDDMFSSLRETFFNYLNIMWDERTNTAELVKYHPANWNPNFVLKAEDHLPDITDTTLIYFAVKPATNYLISETNDILIYVKRPGLMWQEVGFGALHAGDMVIKYPDTTMYVWIQGRFMKLFADDAGSSDIPPITTDNYKIWKPSIDTDGKLTWSLSENTETPDPMEIKGEDGYSPVKGIDYDDGKDGQGIPIGGENGELLVKFSDENFDTTWKSLEQILNDLVISGVGLPDDVIRWDSIKDRPNWYNELGPNEDGFITQAEVTKQIGKLYDRIVEVLEKIDGPTGIEAIYQDLHDHIDDYSNPHRITTAIIGAVSLSTFTGHTQNFNNPHVVTQEQIGLGNIDNTSDMSKPISIATQEALDDLLTRIANINTDVDDINVIVDVQWDNTIGDLIFTFHDQSVINVHIPITEIFNSMYFDEDTKELIVVLPNGNEHRININALIQTYHGNTGTHINVIIEDDNIIKADIIPSSISQYEISPSVHLRGSPTTTTQSVSDSSTRIATTEFTRNQVVNNLISYEVDRPLSANMGRILNERKADIDDVIQIIMDLRGVDVIDTLDSTNASAALSANMGRHLDLTKAPRVHTSPSGATFGRSTISLFGHARASDVDPLMDGTVFRGTDDGFFARSDHRHPTDITRSPLHSPNFTGEPTAPHPTADDNSDRIATTQWIRENISGVIKGDCTTTSTNPIKIATLRSTYMDDPVFIRQIGSTVVINFAHADLSSTEETKLDVHGSGAASIMYEGSLVKDHMIGQNHEHIFSFDGIYWQLLNPVSVLKYDGHIVNGTATTASNDSNGSDIVNTEWVRKNVSGVTYGKSTTASNTATKSIVLESTYVSTPQLLVQKGSSISIIFTNVDTSSGETYLNVPGVSMNAACRYKGLPLVPYMLGTSMAHIFTFDGIYWQLLNPDTVLRTNGTAENLSIYTGTVDELTVTTGFSMNAGTTFMYDDRTMIDPNGRLWTARYNDLAEWMPRANQTDEIYPGDLVSMTEHGIVKATKELNHQVVGVFSDTFGQSLGGDDNAVNMEDNYSNYVPVGLTGRVNVNVTGDVKLGDLLTISDIDGVAMSITEYTPGTVIGKALETHSSSNINRISMLIMNA